MNADSEMARHFDQTAEMSLLGAVLTDETAVADALTACDADDFDFEVHAEVFAAAQQLRADNMGVTPFTVYARLRQSEALEQAGGIEYLKTLCRCCPAAPFSIARDLARIVADLALRRRADQELAEGRQRLRDHSRPIAECLAGVIETTGEAIERTFRQRGQMKGPETIDTLMQKAEAAMNGTPPPAVRSGLTQLDELLGGFHAADFAIVAGRPGMGKSILLSTICKAAALTGNPALLFSLEMPAEQMLQRLICDLDYDNIDPNNIHADPLHYSWFRSGHWRQDQFDRAIAASERLKRLGIEVIDAGGLTIHQIGAAAERFAARHSGKLGIVGIDYLQLVAAGERYRGSRVNEVSEVSAACKGLAKRLAWPVVAGCQLNRAVEGREEKHPRLADLRESGALEQDSDVVIGLLRKAYYLNEKRPEYGTADPGWPVWKAEYDAVAHDLDAAVLKNRHGPVGIAKLHVEIAAAAIRNRPGDERRAA